MVDPDSDRVSRAPPYSGTVSWSLFGFAYRTVTFFGRAVRRIPLPLSFLISTGHPHTALQPRFMRFGLFRVRSPLLTESLLISFPELLRWFTSLRFAPPHYFIHVRGVRVSPYGLLHSDICGSQDMCSSPQLFAACHVLHRLLAPRHPPWTYISLGHIVLLSIHFSLSASTHTSQATV